MKNPFNIGTASHNDFEILKDLKWHCSKCELESAQAKTWQVWRQMGLQMAKDEKGNFYKRKECKNCNKVTFHRALKTLEISDETNIRSPISKTLTNKIKKLYNCEESVLLRKLIPNQLEIDHKFPQIRWENNENINHNNMSAQEIKERFILLNRSNNLLKSRYCEKCFQKGIRGNFPGIYFWHKGNGQWDKSLGKYNEKGCIGCFWYDPYEWRKELNKILNKNKG